MKPVVVIPVSLPDFHLAVKLLRWLAVLHDGSPGYLLIVWCAAALGPGRVERLKKLLPTAEVAVNPVAYERYELGYSACANNMFLQALLMVERHGAPMLWVEADCTPMRATWYEEIAEEFAACGKPFMGDIHVDGGIPHMTGNAVYSAAWRQHAPGLTKVMDRASQGWDTQCAAETFPRSHRSCRIQQIWTQIEFNESAMGAVHPETALFHRCKDGSLIDTLCRRAALPLIPLDAPELRVAPGFPGRHDFTPRHRTEILIVTHARDMDFLRYCIRSIGKYAKGFEGTTLVVPRAEDGQFDWALGYAPVKIKYFDELPDRGMLHHEVQVCMADRWCPDADVILHMDADCMVMDVMTPEAYAPGGRPTLCREAYSICGPRNENRLHWRAAVENATGITPEHCTMVRHPQCNIRQVYAAMRRAVERHTGMDFTEYVLSGRNEFPQSFAEFPTINAVALRDYAARYTIVDYDHERDARECGIRSRDFQYLYRHERDHVVEAWSHGGVERYRAQCEEVLSGRRDHDFFAK